MCGVCGVVFKNKNPGKIEERVKKGVASLRHRGPDADGTYLSKNVCFGHTRLSIIDLSENGSQPKVSKDGSIVISFNGEIYNFKELQRRLQSLGVNFLGSGDTEVLVEHFAWFGVNEASINAIDGMFSIAVHIFDTGDTFLIRDRFGKKPLYFFKANNEVVFSSEIKSLIDICEAGVGYINKSALVPFFRDGFAGHGETFFEGIVKVKPGAYVKIDRLLSIKERAYWELKRSSESNKSSPKEIISNVEDLLIAAVKKRLVADVPVGVLLSGGVDSGLIAAIASRLSDHKLKTVTLGYDSIGDERDAARLSAGFYGSDHRELTITPKDLLDSIECISLRYGEPIGDSSILPTNLLASFASQHATVFLNGDGADEVFGGYRRHQLATIFDLLEKIVPPSVIQHLARTVTTRLSGFVHLGDTQSFLARAIYALSHEMTLDKMGVLGQNCLSPSELAEFLRMPVDEAASNSLFLDRFKDGLLGRNIRDFDLFYNLPGMLLPKMDIGTMAYGIEARSPFLDVDLIEYCYSLPMSSHVTPFSTKRLLRTLGKRYLPKTILSLPKKGFEIPLSDWLSRDLAPRIEEVLLDNSGLFPSIFDVTKIETLLRDCPQRGTKKWGQKVYQFFVLANWMNENRRLAIR
jgi:asparagine synthase (glutamine-hydrolysing)